MNLARETNSLYKTGGRFQYRPTARRSLLAVKDRSCAPEVEAVSITAAWVVRDLLCKTKPESGRPGERESFSIEYEN